MKTPLPPPLVTDAHAYTRSDESWQMDCCTEANGRTASGRDYGWRLFHYLSGGGTQSCGRTLEQDIRDRRQKRFLIVAALLFVGWLCLLVV